MPRPAAPPTATGPCSVAARSSESRWARPPPPAPRARPTLSSPGPSSSTTGASSRPTSGCVTAASSPSARPATPTRWTASTRPSSSGRRRRSWRAPKIVGGTGRILTAGAVDSHVHLIAPQQLEEALGSGITTIIGGGTGPAEGTKATTVTPGAWNLGMMLRSLDGWPVNVALLGKGNTVSPDGLREQLAAGASGFKLHEDWGTTPAAIDACLTICDEQRVQ